MKRPIANILFTATLGLTSAWFSSSIMAAQIDPMTPGDTSESDRRAMAAALALRGHVMA